MTAENNFEKKADALSNVLERTTALQGEILERNELLLSQSEELEQYATEVLENAQTVQAKIKSVLEKIDKLVSPK